MQVNVEDRPCKMISPPSRVSWYSSVVLSHTEPHMELQVSAAALAVALVLHSAFLTKPVEI